MSRIYSCTNIDCCYSRLYICIYSGTSRHKYYSKQVGLQLNFVTPQFSSKAIAVILPAGIVVLAEHVGDCRLLRNNGDIQQ